MTRKTGMLTAPRGCACGGQGSHESLDVSRCRCLEQCCVWPGLGTWQQHAGAAGKSRLLWKQSCRRCLAVWKEGQPPPLPDQPGKQHGPQTAATSSAAAHLFVVLGRPHIDEHRPPQLHLIKCLRSSNIARIRQHCLVRRGD